MCLILFSWQPDAEHPLIVTANRDEFYQRPTRHLDFWPASPIVAGRDELAGGTWLGITRSGRFAAVTNYRQASDMTNTYSLSRGKLCQDFLEDRISTAQYLQQISKDAMQCGGFNLLVSDGKTLGYASNRFGAEQGNPFYQAELALAPGVYGLSNHRLDTPWPKVRRSKQALQRCLQHFRASGNLLPESHFLQVVSDASQAIDAELPDTGIGLDKERFLSSSFIGSSLDYGTRASTILIRDRNGRQTLMEQTWLPGGQRGITTRLYL